MSSTSSIVKSLAIFTLALSLVGCGNDSSDQTPQQAPQQKSQPGQLGQMQESAPDIEVSDKEAEKFVQAAMAAQKVQMKAQKEMVQIIKDNGLEVNEFQKIAQSTQMGQSKPDTIAQSKMDKFDSAQKELKKKQAEIQDKVSSSVEDTGMEMERFQKISQAAQQDTQLQKQLRKKMMQQMGGSKGMQQQPSNN